jgi:hypothetical protein
MTRSGAAQLINSYTTKARGRTRSTITYTTEAFLAALIVRVYLQRTPTLTGIQATIADFTPEQLGAVGMADQDMSAIREDSRREYSRFHQWVTALLLPLDSGADLPARRVSNAVHREQLSRRSQQQRDIAAAATEKALAVINRIVAGSIDDPAPPGYRGDVVADESIFDLANPAAGLGSRPEKNRGAAYIGSYYVRESATGTITTTIKGHEIRKAGFGLGLSAVTRVGPPDALHSVPTVIIGIDVHPPTSGSVEGLRNALIEARRNGLAGPPPSRRRWPYLTVDMGYNVKRDFAATMLELRYSPVARYPKGWNTTFGAVPPKPGGRLPGPIQVAGAFYCPAAAELLTNYNTPKTRDLLETGGWRTHDDTLRRTLPFLMGTNSRPAAGHATGGRPSSRRTHERRVKIELVCPAVQLRVKCPLKPASMTRAEPGTPTAEPTWAAAERSCCANSITTVSLTDDQFRLAQWDLVPGSWEHTTYFEAARALTEQRFAHLKSSSVTGIRDLLDGARREPMLKLILATAVAVANHRTQQAHHRHRQKTESIEMRLAQIAAGLGFDPVRTPPRT